MGADWKDIGDMETKTPRRSPAVTFQLCPHVDRQAMSHQVYKSAAFGQKEPEVAVSGNPLDTDQQSSLRVHRTGTASVTGHCFAETAVSAVKARKMQKKNFSLLLSLGFY